MKACRSLLAVPPVRVLLTLAMVSAWASACSSDGAPSVTAVRVAVGFEAAWELDQLDVNTETRRQIVPETPGPLDVGTSVVVLLADGAAGQSLALDVWGIQGGERIAYVTQTVVPVRGQTVDVAVELVLLPCGAYCVEGTTSCEADGVRTCQPVGAGPCTEWSAPEACPTEAPFCSFGQCAATCVDECAEGDVACAGPNASQACGEADSDTCRDWLASTSCSAGHTCQSGVCSDGACTDDCALGETQCVSAGVATCGQFDGDDCFDLSPPGACGAGLFCSDGACADSCTDDCTESSCARLDWQPCGQFDLDPCLDSAPITACGAVNACEFATCDATLGCDTTPMVCDQAPDPVCQNADTLRVSSAEGSCTAGNCDYPFTDVPCPEGCSGTSCNCAPVSEAVDTVGVTGQFSSLALDAVGGVHIASYNTTDGDLRYAHKPAGSTWTTDTIDTGDAGWDPSLIIDDAGGLHVTYYDFASDDLLYAHKPSGGAWSLPETVDATFDVGRYNSLDIDDTGGLHVSYVDLSTGDLKYAFKQSGGSWVPEVIDSAADVDIATAIVVDGTGAIHIAYYDTDNDDLLYAIKPAGGSWSFEIPDSTGNVGKDCDLVVDGAGNAHISYFDNSNFALKYAFKPLGGAWSRTTVDDIGMVGYQTSLAVGADGVHITHLDLPNGNLKHAHKPNTTWNNTVLESTNDVGRYSSLAVDSAGALHVSHMDQTTSDLRYTKVCP